MKLSVLPICLLFIVGLTFSSFGDVLCVSDSGHVKVESICTPCCVNIENTCLLNRTDFDHEHHDSCDNCSDLPLESPKLLNRYSSADIGTVSFSSILTQIASFNLAYVLHSHSYIKTEDIQSNSKEVDILISTTVIIC